MRQFCTKCSHAIHFLHETKVVYKGYIRRSRDTARPDTILAARDQTCTVQLNCDFLCNRLVEWQLVGAECHNSATSEPNTRREVSKVNHSYPVKIAGAGTIAGQDYWSGTGHGAPGTTGLWNMEIVA
ncbi:hypothetical protein J6590_054366 [Homalodisca vitripennis]|nr:hypothetical protein J6590_105545 [Homalodisca vitripennis]KAG8296550.1 hypothetical protein J6590_054366 [Homalodisca vitripennis]